jgi:DNA-binding NarL/FixJ family response regulator
MNTALTAAEGRATMATVPVEMEENTGKPLDGEANGQFIRVIVADTQAIFRAGLRKIFALEDDVRVVGQAETVAQAFSAAKKFSADILLFEADLAPNPVEAVSELIKQNQELRVVVITPEPREELTLDLFRRGAHAIVSREIEPELLVDCLRAVAKGELWLDRRGIHWVLAAYRSQGSSGVSARTKVHLTPKETLIVSCVTQGMKNKEIAQRVGTTEQVVKNYLRKVYDKLGVADRLELALFCLNNRVIEGQAASKNDASSAPTTAAPAPAPTNGAAAAASASATSGLALSPNKPS